MFGLSLHVWENVMVGSLAFAALAAAIVGVATYAVVQLQRVEIEHSNRTIAEANARAAEASQKASEADRAGPGNLDRTISGISA